jgi:hypothetical protein
MRERLSTPSEHTNQRFGWDHNSEPHVRLYLLKQTKGKSITLETSGAGVQL